MEENRNYKDNISIQQTNAAKIAEQLTKYNETVELLIQFQGDELASLFTSNLRELHDANYQVREGAKRAAMDAPVQGTAADLIKLAMNKVHQALIDNRFETRMILQIHDELIFRVPKNEKEKAYALIKDIMENALNIDVPLLVDGGFGHDWYSAK